ncbi:MAG TPA: inositol monophosphatase family protein [Acidimicrobiales bacterium]
MRATVSDGVDDVLKVELLRLALDVARDVGHELARARRDGVPDATTKTSATDMVTTMDVWAEQHLVERLLGARPDDGVLGEEGTSVSGTTGVQWCIDPIDGTTDYLYDHPGYSVSIAALVDGEPIVGVVHDPALDHLYSAVAGHGAWRDNRPISASSVTDLSVALVGTGFSYDPQRRGRQGQVLARVLPHVRDVRRMGGAALDLCSVGCARLDAFYERGLNLWDVAAGGLVAREAGALVTDLDGNPVWSGMIVAAPPRLHHTLLELLRDAGAGAA